MGFAEMMGFRTQSRADGGGGDLAGGDFRAGSVRHGACGGLFAGRSNLQLACGTGFELPAWGDGGGWTNPSKYTTIQLADLTGNGVDELIGRNDAGIELWRFDKTIGQWRPAVGPDGFAQVLRDFHSPAPSQSGPNWNPQYYRTIQTADLNGDGVEEIIAPSPALPPRCRAR